MPRLSHLLAKLQQLTRDHVTLEVAIKDVQQQILHAKTTVTRRKSRSTSRGVSEGVEATVRVLREADRPLRRSEIANLLGIDGSVVGFRLAQTIRLGFVEKVRYGLYTVTDATKAALK